MEISTKFAIANSIVAGDDINAVFLCAGITPIKLAKTSACGGANLFTRKKQRLVRTSLVKKSFGLNISSNSYVSPLSLRLSE